MRYMTNTFCHDIFNSDKISGVGSPHILTNEEKSLLIQSLPSGQFVVFESANFGDHLVTEEKYWFCEKDEFYQETILNAFSLLCKRGYIRHIKLHLFKLSRDGFEVAYRLLEESQQGGYEVDAA